jgi:hypothetical protein
MRTIITVLTYVTFLLALVFGSVQADAGEVRFELLTNEEAARPVGRNFGFSTKAADNGPAIEVSDLEVPEAKPFALRVRVKARDGAAPDLTTLRVECLKTPIIDLTPRLKPYITAEGVTVAQTTLPPGLHHFRVSINDARGHLSEKDFTIVVSGAF